MSVIKIQNWFAAYLADYMNLEPAKIDPNIPFDRYGLDSSTTVVMIADFEAEFQCNIDPNVVYYHPTIQELSSHLAKTIGNNLSIKS